MKQKISLVIPIYNEVEVIEYVVKDYYNKIIKKLPGSEFIITEDGSTDGTKEILKRLKKELPIKLFMGNKRKGYSKSIRDALSIAKNDIVLFSDSDGQHEPNDFWKLLERIDKCDIVIGHKSKRHDPFYRLVLSRGYNILVGLLIGLWLKDIDSGFRVFKKNVLDDVIHDSITLEECTNSEISIRAFKKGYKICEVPITHRPRKFGKTKSFRIYKMPYVIINLFLDLLKLRREMKRN